MLKRLPLSYETTNFNLIGNVVSDLTPAACEAAYVGGRDRTGKDIGLDILVNSGYMPIPFPTAKGGTVIITCDVYSKDEYDVYTRNSAGSYEFKVLRSELYSADEEWIQKVTVVPNFDSIYVCVPLLTGTVILNAPSTPAFLLSAVIRNIVPTILDSISFTNSGFTFSWEDYDSIVVAPGVAYYSYDNTLVVLEDEYVVEVDFDLIEDGGEITVAVYVDLQAGNIELLYGEEAAEGESTVMMPSLANVIPLGYITFTVDEYGEGVISGAEVYTEG